MKILNLYAGIGGNRKLWGDEHEITAVEWKPEIANIYSHFFPNDKMVVGDAHQYLLDHFEEFDFIWTSPPCPSNSRIRNIAGVGSGHTKAIYPDMKLYEEIIFLNHVFCSSGTKFNGKYVVENVISYYAPLIVPYELEGHYFWSNFIIVNNMKAVDRAHTKGVSKLEERKQFDLSMFNIDDKEKILRNCTEPELGLYVFNAAFKQKQEVLA